MPLLKLAALLREGSGSMVGIPVADVVVVHVLVDIRRRRLGATKRFPRCKDQREEEENNNRVSRQYADIKVGAHKIPISPCFNTTMLAVRGTKQCSRIG